MPDLEALLEKLELDEKASLVNGNGMWTVPGVERLGIPQLKVTDGPNGARGDGLVGTGLPALCIPCGSALGATFHPALVERLGAALGVEARSKKSHVLLAPTINIHRAPVGGRNFECYSEDPLLSGKTAAAFIRGVQSQRVACTPKHFVANDAEFERTTMNSVVDERALREIYLRPFEIAIKEGGAWGLMAAYNRLNGTFCCEHPFLLTEILRNEWGFDGVVVTDWLANRSVAASAQAGLDLEMPGPGRMWGRGKLADAVREGALSSETLDAMVRRLLRLLDRTGAFEDPLLGPEESHQRADHVALAAEAAAESMVLLKNERSLLPLTPDRLQKIAVIGPNADRAQIMGGGSAKLRAFHYTSPLDALRSRLGKESEIVFERGCVTDKTPPAIPGPFEGEFFDGHDLAGDAIGARVYGSSEVVVMGGFEAASERETFSVRTRATFTPTETGPHTFSLVALSWARVFVDDELVIDAWREGIPRGREFFGMGSAPLEGTAELERDRDVEVRVEFSSREARLFAGFKLGCSLPEDDGSIARAAFVASNADVALVIVGTNDDWESEGRDRDAIALPGASDELVSAVAAANPDTVVIVNAGSPVAMPWVDQVPSILDVWFGGQEMAGALAEVLIGERVPSGKLPTTFPEKIEHNPAWTNFPGENSELRYGEGVFVGYRHYDSTDRRPLFPFGHGLSYSSFELSGGSLSAPRIVAGSPLRVSATLRNLGERRAAEVVQCYVEPSDPRLARPLRELVAFEKVWLDPGEEKTLHLELDERALAYWDPGDRDFERLGKSLSVPASGGQARRTHAGWAIDPGEYRICLGTSSRDLPIRLTLTVSDD